MTLALKTIELSIAYAIWSGLGTVLIVTIGILWFKESVSIVKILSIVLIIIGVIGLHLSNEPVSEEGILSTAGASVDQLETTQPSKTKDILPPVSDQALIMPEISVEYLQSEKVPIIKVELSKNHAED